MNTEEQAKAFTTLLYTKGYRGHFTLQPDHRRFHPHYGDFKACMTKFVHECVSNQMPICGFLATTSESSINKGEKNECRFHVDYDEKEGFQVKVMDIQATDPKDNRRLTIRNNHEVPGSQAVRVMFRRKRPWDDIMRGRFPGGPKR